MSEEIEDSIREISTVNLTKILIYIGISFAFLIFVPLLIQVIDLFPILTSTIQGTIIGSGSDLLSIMLYLLLSVMINSLIIFVIFIMIIWLGSWIVKKLNITIIRTKNQLTLRIILQVGGFVLGFFLFSYPYLSLLLINPISILLNVYNLSSFTLNFFIVLANLIFIPILISYGFVFLNDVIFYFYRRIAKKKIVEIDSGEYSYSVPKKKSKHSKRNKWLKVTLILFVIISVLFLGKIFMRGTATVRLSFSSDFSIECRNIDPYNNILIYNGSFSVFGAPTNNVSSIPTYLGYFGIQEYRHTRIIIYPPTLLKDSVFIDNIPKNFYYAFQIHIAFKYNGSSPLKYASITLLTQTGTQESFNQLNNLAPESQKVLFLSATLILSKISFDYDVTSNIVENVTAETTAVFQFNIIDMLIYP